jgi:hypothetical protein
LYLKLGLAPVPLPSQAKDPGFSDWPNFRLKPEDLDRHFPPGQPRNVAVLNGAPSDNRHDADLDVPEAIRAAPRLLPETGWIFGRKSAPASHYVYRTDICLDAAQEKYRDLDSKTLVELRGTGGITVYPGSLHEDTGEPIRWERFLQPAELPLADLQRAVRELAACCLLARHMPAKGSRQDAYLALSGGLIRGGWDVGRAERFVEAVATASEDEEVKKRIETVQDTADKRGEDKHTTGWKRLGELLDRGKEVVGRLLEWLGLDRHTTPATPSLLPPQENPWPDDLAEEALYGTPGEVVRLIDPSTEAAPVAILVQTLLGFGNLVGRHAYFTAESDKHYPNEFAVLVGPTAKARKGTSWGRVRRVLTLMDEIWERERVQSGLSSGEGLIWSVRDPITKMERVKEKGEAPRYEEVVADPGVEDKRLFVLEPEFANVLKQTERQGNTLSTALRLSWDGLDLRTMTKNSPARAKGAHVSLVGHITADELRRYMSTTEMANGFGNCFLWICARRSKKLALGGRVDGDALEGLARKMAEALDSAKQAGEVERDGEANALWVDLYDRLSEDRPGMAGALLARAEAHVMRLAMLYALLDGGNVIKPEHLLAAVAVWEYAQHSVYHIFGDALGDPVADDILRLLRANPDGAARTDLMNYFGRNQSSERIGRALGLLVVHRRVEARRVETGGRPQERWFAVCREGDLSR